MVKYSRTIDNSLNNDYNYYSHKYDYNTKGRIIVKKYVLCTTTNKLHIDGCYHLKGVMAEHRMEFDSIDDAECSCDKNLIPCKHCVSKGLLKE